jgi:pimeloyl-ACP methyl ester carboxylesterase
MSQLWRGATGLLFDAVDAITNLVERTHARLAHKALSHIEPVTREVPLLTSAATASGVYHSIRGVNGLVRRAVDATADRVAPPALRADTSSGHQHPSASLPPTPQRSDAAWSWPWLADHAQSVLNGFLGDHIAARRNALDLGLTFRQEGRMLPLERDALAAAYPDAATRVCVFVHGLSATEWSWNAHAERFHGDPGTSFGTLLAARLGYQPLYVRYNTGRHISENGQLLAARLDELLATYPVEIEELVLVGHSMGGLVARSAASQADAAGAAWIRPLRQIVCIATPHLGSPLEKAANLLGGLLGAIDTPGTQVPAQILAARSAGIKDLRYGYTLDTEWQGKDPDAVLADERLDVPQVAGVDYVFLGSTLARDPRRPLGVILGDILVRWPSAVGHAHEPTRRIPFSNARVFGGIGHVEVINHPEVYAVLEACLVGRFAAPDRAVTPGSVGRPPPGRPRTHPSRPGDGTRC